MQTIDYPHVTKALINRSEQKYIATFLFLYSTTEFANLQIQGIVFAGIAVPLQSPEEIRELYFTCLF